MQSPQIKREQSLAEPCLPNERKSNARSKRHARARQYALRHRRMERTAHEKSLTIHTRCACGCGLVIKPSIKRPFAPGHKKFTAPKHLRVVPNFVVSQNNSNQHVRSKTAELLKEAGAAFGPIPSVKTNFCPECRAYVAQNHLHEVRA